MLILNFIANITVLSDLYNINYMYTLKHSYLFKKTLKPPTMQHKNVTFITAVKCITAVKQ